MEEELEIFERDALELGIESSKGSSRKNLNLNLITTYKNKYKCDIGYSGHESTVSPTIFAWILGAEYIERHIT